MLLLSAGDALSDSARARLESVFDTDDPNGKLNAAWEVEEQVRGLLRAGPLKDAELAKARLEELVHALRQPETTRLLRAIFRGWKKIDVLIVTGSTTGKVKRTTQLADSPIWYR